MQIFSHIWYTADKFSEKMFPFRQIFQTIEQSIYGLSCIRKLKIRFNSLCDYASFEIYCIIVPLLVWKKMDEMGKIKRDCVKKLPTYMVIVIKPR